MTPKVFSSLGHGNTYNQYNWAPAEFPYRYPANDAKQRRTRITRQGSDPRLPTMSTQTWAAWLLDSYASSVSPVASEHPDLHDDDNNSSDNHSSTASPTSTTRSLTSSHTSMSPYGPCARTGRGGAGNFHWNSDQNQYQTQDLEAQDMKTSSLSERRQAAAKLERIETGEAMKSRQPSQYLHLGRGGAGNYSQSNEMQPVRSSRAVSSPVYTATPTLGRGGAGNAMLAHDTKKKLQLEREQRERAVAERTREEIEHQVETIIQPPPGARLNTSRRTSMLLESV